MQVDKEYFDSLIAQYNDYQYFVNDPISCVRPYSEVKDIEIAGFLCSWVAYGNRNQIVKTCHILNDLMNHEPYNYLMLRDWEQFKDDNRVLYRFYRYGDLYDMFVSLYAIYEQFSTMEQIIVEAGGDDYIAPLLKWFNVKGVPKDAKSACKRVGMFLRWMVRQDGRVDIGIWRRLRSENLLIPLDVHVVNMAHQLGLVTRKSVDMKAALQLRDVAKKYYPNDPAILDFALFGYDYYKDKG